MAYAYLFKYIIIGDTGEARGAPGGRARGPLGAGAAGAGGGAGAGLPLPPRPAAPFPQCWSW